MSFEFEDTKRNITNEDLLADLRRVAASLATGVLTQRAYRDSGRYSTTVIKKRFGKWKTAVTTAGFEAGSEQHIPADELFDNLREVWIKLGRQPRKREMVSPFSKYTHNPYVRLFGGWVDAMRAFTRTVNETESDVGSFKNLPTRDGRGPREPSLRLRFLVMRRDRFKCVLCGRAPAIDPTTELHIDHVVAWSKEGRTEMSNLRTLCSRCNLGKADLAAHAG
jgi:hypothetical protein